SDGLTGESFDAMTTMTTEYSRYEFYEKVIAGFSAGEYFASFFEHDGAGTYRFSVFKTTDNWATVSKIQVFEDDTIRLAEAALVKLPNTLLAIARDQGASGGLWQTYSTDGGDTWSSPQKTNLVAEGVANASMCLNDNGKIDILYVSREFHEIYLSTDNDPATVLADETAWNEGTLINNAYATDGLGILGYPSILNAGGNYRAMMFSTEFSTTRADLFVGYGLIDEL
ncbi:MAG TPA: sialidase family protein, partial [Chryseosolibacter sp.]|nr:sialidase family protein [Chryseosolibacter sp.]